MLEALHDDELACVLAMLDARSLCAAEACCRRMRRVALSPAVCRAHRPSGGAWARLPDREALVAWRAAQVGWSRARWTGRVLKLGLRGTMHLDGSSLYTYRLGEQGITVCDLDDRAPRSVPIPFVAFDDDDWHPARWVATMRADAGRVAALCGVPCRRDVARLWAGTPDGAMRPMRAYPVWSATGLVWQRGLVAYSALDDAGTPVLERWDPVADSSAHVCDRSSLSVHGPGRAFSLADGHSIAVASGRDSLWVSDDRCGRPALLPVQHAPRARIHDRYCCHAHPDGRTVAVLGSCYMCDPVTVQLWDLRAPGQLRHVCFQHGGGGGGVRFLCFGHDRLWLGQSHRVVGWDMRADALPYDAYMLYCGDDDDSDRDGPDDYRHAASETRVVCAARHGTTAVFELDADRCAASRRRGEVPDVRG